MRASNHSNNSSYNRRTGLQSVYSRRNDNWGSFSNNNNENRNNNDPDFLTVAKDLAAALQKSFLLSSDDEEDYVQLDNNENNNSFRNKNCNNKFCDIQLLSSDGITYVSACRFVLAARSRVLQQMLYGNFKEAKSSTICLMGYDSCILHSIVYFCTFNQLRLNIKNNNDNMNDREEEFIRRLVQLGQAADYLELPYLVQLVEDKVRRMMAQYPPLACAVFDEAMEPTTTTTTSPITNTSSISNSSLHLVEESSREQQNLDSVTKHNNRKNSGKDSNISLFDYAFRFIECRPYVTLDCDNDDLTYCGVGGGIGCIHNLNKLEYIMKDSNISAGELFLFQMLERWYEVHVRNAIEINSSASSSSDSNKNMLTYEAYYDVAKKCSTQYIRFHNIEPNQMLLSDGIIQQHILKYNNSSATPTNLIQNPMKSLVSSDQIFTAVAQQALRSSKDGVWRISFRQGHISFNNSSASTTSNNSSSSNELERILVEGSGNKDANGMYYRIAAGLNLANGDLYSKRETTCGQSVVYTLSCCTISVPVSTENNQGKSTDYTDNNKGSFCSGEKQRSLYGNNIAFSDKGTHYREYRIFSSQFLTYHAVRNLDMLQSSSDFSPLFQPVLQVIIDIVEPDETNLQIPTPIRKFYRVRLSDSELHMTGTFASELSYLFEQNEISINCVIKVLEYGLYQVSSDGTESSEPNVRSITGIHVIKASVVTTAPLHPFGEPIALEVYNSQQNSTSSMPNSLIEGMATMNDPDECTYQGLQNLYICSYPIDTATNNATTTVAIATNGTYINNTIGSNIPRSGWKLGDHGINPVPTCTWIPVVKRTKESNTNKDNCKK